MDDHKIKTNYSTVVSMFKELDLDPNDWINKEQKDYYFNQKKRDRTPQNVMYYPADLNKISLKCINNHTFKPNWLEKRFPSMPFRLRSGELFQPITANVSCPECSEYTEINLPTNPNYTGDVKLYGDEAIRDFNNKIIMSYSVISQPRDENIHKEFSTAFLELKKTLAPKLSPKSWTLHYMDLMNAGLRSKQPHLKHLTKDQVLDYSKKLGELISKYPDQITKWNCTGVYIKPTQYKKKQEQELKSRVYYPLIGRIITETTDSSISPHFYFEQTGSDGWAKNLFNGGRLTLMWPFISHVLPVPNPKFVHPTDSIYLEVADFISFVIARYLFVVGKKAEGENIDFECLPSWLGEVRYLGYSNTGTCLFETEIDYPLKKFFQGTPWYSIK
jgi:hypothetical protein